MADQLRLLRKENKLRRACLKKENREMLDKWITYAKASDINPYDFELCCKELIGIALQKELEGKDLEHFFGEDSVFHLCLENKILNQLDNSRSTGYYLSHSARWIRDCINCVLQKVY